MSAAIAVIGLGFVGLTTALGLAEKGRLVAGFDADPERQATLGRRQIPFHEPGLDTALERHLGHGFRLATSLEQAIGSAEVVFLCVGTPSDDTGAADLSILRAAIRQIAGAANAPPYQLLVIKSTVPPGTLEEVIAPDLAGLGAGRAIGLASNPEFLREGCAWDDFIAADRIVVGVAEDRDWALLADTYRDFAAPVLRVRPTEAEFIKYLSNCLLASMISFANEMALVADAVGNIDIARCFGILHQDKRWSGSPAAMAAYVYPGCGYGGYCLPKDTRALAHRAREKGLVAGLLEQVIATNARTQAAAVDRIVAAAAPGTRIGILGLAFKPASDDVRDSPARTIIQGLLDRGWTRIVAHDPLAMPGFAATFGLPIAYAPSLDAAIAAVDLLVIVTAWADYRALPALAAGKPIIDLRYCRTPEPAP